MGGVALCDQMTILNKSRKQRWLYLLVFLKLVMQAIHNNYIREGFLIDHTSVGRRKRDLLQYKEELCIPLFGNYPQTYLQALADAKQRRNVLGSFSTLVCTFQSEERGQTISLWCVRRSSRRPRGLTQTLLSSTTKPQGVANVVYLRLTAEICFYDYHTKEQFWL